MLGIHKLQDAAALRTYVQAACAEARLAEHSNAATSERSHSVISVTNTIVDGDASSIAVSNNEDAVTSATVTCTDMLSGVPVQSDVHLGDSTPAGQPLAVPLSSSQCHNDTPASVADNLPHYYFLC